MYIPIPDVFFPEAWHIVNTTDPLAASDDEEIDDNVRLDYSEAF
jgi:Ino eighty subunit 1